MLDNGTLALIAGWSPADVRQALGAWRTANPAAPGLSSDIAIGSLTEMRVLDILIQSLPAQLAATPLIPPEHQDMADRYAAFYEDSDISTWTQKYPAPAATFFLGELTATSLVEKTMPAVLVSTSMPGGEDHSRGTLGTTRDDTITLNIYYIVDYDPSIQLNIEALRGAEAIANILSRYYQDDVTFWQDGKVQSTRRNVPMGRDGVPEYSVGMVSFSCEARRRVTPIRKM